MSRAQILSVVTVVDRTDTLPQDALTRLHQAAASMDIAVEVVVVLNGCGAAVVDATRALAERLPDFQVYVLKRPVDLSTALFAGLENAVGDWVAMLDLERDEPEIVRELLKAGVDSGSEVVLGVPEHAARRQGLADAVLSRLFHRAFRMLHGYSLTQEAPTARLLSRGVINQVLRHEAPLVALQTLAATGGYRKKTITAHAPGARALPMGERIRSRWRVLIGINAVPLRLANLLCGVGALIAVLYSVYVVAIYLFKSDVMPGWTTVSLMLSGMFFLLSLVLWLISEYLVLLMDANSRRPRYETGEEFASNVQTRRQHLNVEAEL